MFSKQAIEQYSNRDLEDYNWIKEGVYPDLLGESIKSTVQCLIQNHPIYSSTCWRVFRSLFGSILFLLDMGLENYISSYINSM